MTQSTATPLPPPRERRRLREAHALTRDQVAERLGVSRSTVRAWESGHRVPEGEEGAAYAGLLAALTRPADTTTGPGPGPGPGPGLLGAQPLTPAQAFDALYAFCAPALVRQTYLLTGRRDLAREVVERAFQLAWQRWPEIAQDRDPASWVRAMAYDCALSPWHRFRPRYRHPEPPPADPADRALLHALLELPPAYRRTVVLYDGVGLDLPETAAETEASTPAAASRLTHAREALAACLPELADPAELHRRLLGLASAERLRAERPTVVRVCGERRNVFWTRAAIAFTVTIIGATTLTLRTAPTHYEPPVAPAQAVQGVPPRAALGPLSHEEQALQAKLRQEAASGPERLAPDDR
ncbi:helix-turn-helix domain-containing protein [Streptomyces sp. LP11]|uniref:Helix-turn-helix domain-containing protein n=1 Tax=Streptomyces pyxinicus TaxID=2970331 RepID=A0ABT2AVC6_9ACTN|nr:transcriptional regulator [Streptomyces sp. LP11]MCS0600125.1 helix-turn-helix domain-containing protein [Streptomyces sp. LP11]